MSQYFVTFEFAGYSDNPPRQSIEKWKLGGYMTAEAGGGTEVKANKYQMGAWEIFHLVVVSGGDLRSGEFIYLLSSGQEKANIPPHHVITRQTDGGYQLFASTRTPDEGTRFQVLKVGASDGAQINSWDKVVLLAMNGNHVTKDSPDGRLSANGQEHGQWRLGIHRKIG